MGQTTDALQHFRMALQLDPKDAEAHFNLGVAYLQVGKKHEAEEQQQLLVKLNPELATKLDSLIKK